MHQADLWAAIDYIGDESNPRPTFDFHTGERTTLVCRQEEMPIIDARELADPPQLEREGFTLLNHKTSITLSDTKAHIDAVYHQELGGALGDMFGAYLVIPFRIGMLIRRPPAGRVYTEQMKGTRIAHLDYTKASMDMWVPVCAQMEGADPGSYSRFAVYQTWRMFAPPPQNETLALCDTRSIAKGDDLVFDSIISDDDRQTFESRVMRHNPGHRWMYWNNLTPEEVIVFKGWDSDPSRVSDVPHQAISDPKAGPSPVLRESIETRFFLFFR